MDTANVIGMFLMQEGYGVRCVESRDHALVVLQAYLYDVIIMDFFMPGMGAAEFVTESRRRCPRSKFLLITATNIAAEQAAKIGINEFLGKPFKPEELLPIIRRCHG